jgi:quinol monooxygenase YgiN
VAESDDLTLVTMQFEALDAERLVAALARYVVLSRGHPGCRNIDLCQSAIDPRRFVVIQKWASAADQRAHLDSEEFRELAAACEGLVRSKPAVDMLDGLSAHDLA